MSGASETPRHDGKANTLIEHCIGKCTSIEDFLPERRKARQRERARNVKRERREEGEKERQHERE